ncbi:MAG: GNAT family protein [Pseudomonadota bacterium]
MPFITPVTLSGQHASLEPLLQDHLEGIKAAAADGQLWNLFYTSVPSADMTQAWLDTAHRMRDEQGALVFAVRDQRTNNIVGSTRFWNVDPVNRRLEIGYTWYAESAHRTGINTECKLMLLTHAFEVLNCIAVELCTDWFNHRSQAAIERLGAKRDGVRRNHTILKGRIRDTVVYSILQSEWHGVKMNLQAKLQRR